jgi:hypothetical protein
MRSAAASRPGSLSALSRASGTPTYSMTGELNGEKIEATPRKESETSWAAVLLLETAASRQADARDDSSEPKAVDSADLSALSRASGTPTYSMTGELNGEKIEATPRKETAAPPRRVGNVLGSGIAARDGGKPPSGCPRRFLRAQGRERAELRRTA